MHKTLVLKKSHTRAQDFSQLPLRVHRKRILIGLRNLVWRVESSGKLNQQKAAASILLLPAHTLPVTSFSM